MSRCSSNRLSVVSSANVSVQPRRYECECLNTRKRWSDAPLRNLTCARGGASDTVRVTARRPSTVTADGNPYHHLTPVSRQVRSKIGVTAILGRTGWLEKRGVVSVVPKSATESARTHVAMAARTIWSGPRRHQLDIRTRRNRPAERVDTLVLNQTQAHRHAHSAQLFANRMTETDFGTRHLT